MRLWHSPCQRTPLGCNLVSHVSTCWLTGLGLGTPSRYLARMISWNALLLLLLLLTTCFQLVTLGLQLSAPLQRLCHRLQAEEVMECLSCACRAAFHAIIVTQGAEADVQCLTDKLPGGRPCRCMRLSHPKQHSQTSSVTSISVSAHSISTCYGNVISIAQTQTG